MNIVLLGKKESGKTTTANILTDYYGIQRISFARALKELIYDCSGLDDSAKNKKGSYPRNVDFNVIYKNLKNNGYDALTQEEIDTIRAIEYYPINEVYRNLLQYIGTNVYRKRNYNHWLSFFNLDAERAIIKYGGYVCDDCRFLNEFEFNTYNLKATSIRIINSKERQKEDDSHPSETEIDNVKTNHVIINNMNGLEELKNNILNLNLK